HERTDLFVGGIGGERDGGLFASLFGGVFGMLRSQPFSRGNETSERLRQLRQQCLSYRRRQILTRQKIFADRCQMTKPINSTRKREGRDLGGRIFQKRQTGFRRTDLEDGGRKCARHRSAAGDRHLHIGITGGGQVDQIIVKQERRLLQHR